MVSQITSVIFNPIIDWLFIHVKHVDPPRNPEELKSEIAKDAGLLRNISGYEKMGIDADKATKYISKYNDGFLDRTMT